jgi:DNA-3-methyladenine glycosylase I
MSLGNAKSLKIRCAWSRTNELFIPYHDKQWGVPVYDDNLLFEMLNLEGAQAGLSWLTILKRRDAYREAFDNFDAIKIIKYDEFKKAELMNNEGIIRNRLKINAVIENSKSFLSITDRFESFDNYLWSFTGGKHLTQADHELSAKISELMSKELKKNGFKFVGPTICYAFMQAVGMINDHSLECFRYQEIESAIS